MSETEENKRLSKSKISVVVMIDERVERDFLREKFKEETGLNWEKSQGGTDIEYVWWLEAKLFNQKQ